MDDNIFLNLEFSQDLKNSLSDSKKNQNKAEEVKNEYRKECQYIMQKNMEQLESCISNNTKNLIPSKPYDISFLCKVFWKMPKYKSELNQGYGNLAKFDESELIFYRNINYINSPMTNLGLINCVWKMNTNEWVEMPNKVYANYNDNMPNNLIPKNTFAILDREINNHTNNKSDWKYNNSCTCDKFI